jgi:hypothetical protein
MAKKKTVKKTVKKTSVKVPPMGITAEAVSEMAGACALEKGLCHGTAKHFALKQVVKACLALEAVLLNE